MDKKITLLRQTSEKALKNRDFIVGKLGESVILNKIGVARGLYVLGIFDRFFVQNRPGFALFTAL